MRGSYKCTPGKRSECRQICDSCLNGLEAQYGIQFMPVLALALPLPISISFEIKLPLNYPSSVTSHVGQVINWDKEGLKSRHCYCTVYNQSQRECSGKHTRAAVPLACSRKLCQQVLLALSASFLLSLWNHLRHNLQKCNSSVFFVRK